MSKKPIVSLFFLFFLWIFSMEMVFCAEEFLQKKRVVGVAFNSEKSSRKRSKIENKQSEEPRRSDEVTDLRKRKIAVMSEAIEDNQIVPSAPKRSKRVANQDLQNLQKLTLRELCKKINAGEVEFLCLKDLKQEQKNAILLEGIVNNYFQVISDILDAQANPNTQNGKGKRPIYDLISDCSGLSSNTHHQDFYQKRSKFKLRAIEKLLCAKANVNLENDDGFRPLQVAASDTYALRSSVTLHYDKNLHIVSLENDLKCIKLLLKYKADPNTVGGRIDLLPLHCTLNDRYGALFNGTPNLDTSVHMKTLNLKEETAKLLLKAKADVNATDQHNNTSLHRALPVGYPPTIKLLLECKADVNVRNQDGLMPIHIAAVQDQRDFPITTIQILQHGGCIRQETLAGNTSIDLTANSAVAQLLKDMVEWGIEKNPLFLACLVPNRDIVFKLIGENVDVNQADSKGVTPLMYVTCAAKKRAYPSTEQEAEEVIKILMEANANPGIMAKNGNTALGVGSCKTKRIIMRFNLDKKRAENIKYLEENGWPFGLVALIFEFVGEYETEHTNQSH